MLVFLFCGIFWLVEVSVENWLYLSIKKFCITESKNDFKRQWSCKGTICINLELKNLGKTCLIVGKSWFFEIRLEIYIQLIWNISENIVDFRNFQNILDK